VERYKQIVAKLATEDGQTNLLFKKVYSGASLAERVEAWNKLHEKGQPLYENDPIEQVVAVAVEPYVDELGEKVVDVQVLGELFKLDLEAPKHIEYYDGEPVWGKLFETYKKLPIVDQVELFKQAVNTRPNGWIVEQLYGHIKEQVTGTVSRFIPLLDDAFATINIDEIKDELLALADVLLEQNKV